jgi:hypothetical protein
VAAFLLSAEDDMLKPSWYLPDTDWFGQLPSAPRLDDDGQAVIDQLARMLGDDPGVSAAVTIAMTHVILLAAEHLGDTMTHAAALHDLTELARLLCGLNLAQAHLTQMIQRIASNTDARAYPGAAELPDRLLRAITDSLSAAGANSELLAGHLKEAHLLLHGLTQ